MRGTQQMAFDQISTVKDYYGKVLKSKMDLQTSACCTAEAMPEHLRPLLKDIHPEVKDRFYGCGAPFPSALEGLTILDLGSGTGRDCYMLSKLVGETGAVIGVDMTDEQLAVAESHKEFHREKFGYAKSNVSFRKGYIEDLASADIADNSVDLVVSNCVLNLSPNKTAAFREIFRVLKPGGELYFSDVFTDRRLPEEIAKDPVFVGECLGGAMYTEDFRRLLAEVGCADPRRINNSEIAINNRDMQDRAGLARFYSITVRAFKLDLEDRCEDHGQVATYKGGIPTSPAYFDLDDHHRFEVGKPMLVCGNTARMLEESRFQPYFEIQGDRSKHFGLFDCGPTTAGGTEVSTADACC